MGAPLGCWGCPVNQVEQIVEGIAIPDDLDRRHVVAGARQVIAEGLLPRDGTVLDRARRLAQAETPEVRELWADVSVLLRRSVPESSWRIWLERIVPAAEGDRLVLLVPADRASWVRRRYARLIREAVERVDVEGRWAGLVLRPVGPEPRPASVKAPPTYREQRRSAA